MPPGVAHGALPDAVLLQSCSPVADGVVAVVLHERWRDSSARGRFFLFGGDDVAELGGLSEAVVWEDQGTGFREALVGDVESFCFALSGDGLDTLTAEASGFVARGSFLVVSVAVAVAVSEELAVALSFLVCQTV